MYIDDSVSQTHHVNKLGQFELQPDRNGLRDVDDWPDQLVVPGEDLVVESLGVRVTHPGV